MTVAGTDHTFTPHERPGFVSFDQTPDKFGTHARALDKARAELPTHLQAPPHSVADGQPRKRSPSGSRGRS